MEIFWKEPAALEDDVVGLLVHEMFMPYLPYSFHSKVTEQIVEHVALFYFLRFFQPLMLETNNDTVTFFLQASHLIMTLS